MKHIYANPRKSPILSLLLVSLFFLSPFDLFGQKGGSKNDIYITTSCVEYLGDGTMKVYFGYENTGKKTVVVDESGSVVTYNHGQAKKYGIYSFEPGVHEKAFSQEFDNKDRVEWTVVLADGTEKTTDANINSNHCTDPQASLDIVPGYNPPEGGKEYNTLIGAELTSLYEFFMADPTGFPGVSDEIFQIKGTKVLIEAFSYPNTYNDLLNSLDSIGFELVSTETGLKRVTGWIEISDLMSLNFLSSLLSARNVFPGVPNYIVPATGLTKSQGDFSMHSDFARLGYDIDGSGVKIGVLSNSYNTQGTAHIDVGNGDLGASGGCVHFGHPFG